MAEIAEISKYYAATLGEDERGSVGAVQNNGSIIRILDRAGLFVVRIGLYESPYALHANGERVSLEWGQEVEIIADGYDLVKRYIRRVDQFSN